MTRFFNRRSILVGGVALPLGACDWLETDTAQWTEEIKLHDGRFIRLERAAARKSGGFPSADRGELRYYSIKYPDAGLYWKGDWSRQPFSFEIFDNTAYLATFIVDRRLGCKNKLPTDFAAEFYRFRAGGWETLPQSAYPTSAALMNLYINFWGHTKKDDPHGLLRWKSPRSGDDFNPDKTLTINDFFVKYQNFLCGHNSK